MKTFISLLRGINVSGHKSIRMADLRATYERLGFTAVRTYLQSGNVVFRGGGEAKTHGPAIQAAIQQDFGHEVPVLVLTAADWARVAEGSPFLGRKEIDAAFLHVTFLGEKPQGQVAMDSFPAAKGEEVIFHLGQLYLFCPHGYGTTKLSNAYFERALKVPATTRNWRTVLALQELAATG